jgi:predicted nucleic acid-binding protein
MSYVVDASVAVKWVVAESETADALAFLQRERPRGLVAPDLLVAEVSNVAWKKARLGEIDRLQALEAARRIGLTMTRFYPSRFLNQRALEIAMEIDHPLYDCLYLACSEAEGALLVSIDSRMARKLAGTRYSQRFIDLVEALKR